MSMFDGVDDANMRRQSEYVRPGRYLFQIRQFRAINTRKNGPAVVFNLNVLLVLDDGDAIEDPLGAHRVGDEVSWMILQRWDSFLPTVKTAIVKVTNCEPDEVTPQMCAMMTDEARQPMKGCIFEASIRFKPTQDNGRFTNVNVVRSWTEEEALEVIAPEIAEAFGVGQGGIPEPAQKPQPARRAPTAVRAQPLPAPRQVVRQASPVNGVQRVSRAPQPAPGPIDRVVARKAAAVPARAPVAAPRPAPRQAVAPGQMRGVPARAPAPVNQRLAAAGRAGVRQPVRQVVEEPELIEEAVEYVDEFGQPCDEAGNPLQ